jgi:large subunit ribosomal protein L27
MATTKAAGTTRLGRDSEAKRLGVKLFAGQNTKPGDIIIRQRGTKFIAGKNVRRGSDNTLYSITKGVVQFSTKNKTRFDGNRRKVKVVNVV